MFIKYFIIISVYVTTFGICAMEREPNKTQLHKIINLSDEVVRILITKDKTVLDTVNVDEKKGKIVNLPLTPSYTLKVFQGGKNIASYTPSGRTGAIDYIVNGPRGTGAYQTDLPNIEPIQPADQLATAIRIQPPLAKPEESVVIKRVNNLSPFNVRLHVGKETFQVKPSEDKKLNLDVIRTVPLTIITIDSQKREHTASYKPSGRTPTLIITIDPDGAIFIAEAEDQGKGKHIQFNPEVQIKHIPKAGH